MTKKCIYDLGLLQNSYVVFHGAHITAPISGNLAHVFAQPLTSVRYTAAGSG